MAAYGHATYHRRMRFIPRTARRPQMTRIDVTELAHRESGGVEVALFWERRSNRLTVLVADASSGESFELQVASAEALDAFEHPYAYAARIGVPFLPPPEPALAVSG
jgi:hypothetical protein